MKAKAWIMLLILILLLSGCSKPENSTLPLAFIEANKVKINDLQLDTIDEIIQERTIDNGARVLIFKDKEDGQIKGGINLRDKYYQIGEVSVENTPEGLMGIEEVQVFGKEAIKIYGILGTSYAQAFYWFTQESFQESIIQVDGNTIEVDLDNDGKQEIVSTLGTIPQTKIYILDENKIFVCDINESIGAESSILKDRDKKIFEIYFQPNKPKKYMYDKGLLKEIVK